MHRKQHKKESSVMYWLVPVKRVNLASVYCYGQTLAN
uniref:Uncharacterized protein n=1 Tax=Arundo donax TaxID=35708 RepID=A0A0A9B975_ARUDO